MGRKKARPHRSGVLPTNFSRGIDKLNAEDKLVGLVKENDNDENLESCEPFYVNVDSSSWASADHLDIAEVVLKNTSWTNGYVDRRLVKFEDDDPGMSLRFRLPRVGDDSFRLGHWPVLSAETIVLEFSAKCTVEDGKAILSGTFDGPDGNVSGLVHLVNQKILNLRPVIEDNDLGMVLTSRVRVEILRSAFDLCDSLLDIPRQPWRKSMMNVMSWLRPEVTTSEAKYRSCTLPAINSQQPEATGDSEDIHSDNLFDVVRFYEAIKPTKQEPMVEEKLPDLLLQLRPYQRRAAYWMIQRERATPDSSFVNHAELSSSSVSHAELSSSPLCVPVVFLDGHTRMFYNPFCGTVSVCPEISASHVYGGILADEMGLGKTIELLACISIHRMSSMGETVSFINEAPKEKCRIKRVKQDRVECICGAVTESPKYEGLWVQCDICDAWQHAECVGYHPRRNSKKRKYNQQTSQKKSQSSRSKLGANKNDSSNVIESGEDYICSVCLELTEAASSKITSKATLIVCPAPILVQWYSEIIRHTGHGSMKTCIYEGARNLNSNTFISEMTRLANADIVLTTYDVLKEDLSHDSDRYDGDRRLMRFQKRYPVIPTVLTRIYWWRLCLDEAQMVESNTASVTEMALRLCARYKWCITGTPIQCRLDDLYGLLRFLGATPFDVYKWWAEVIRDPYERRDTLAMEFTHDFFKNIMWRSAKSHVSDELGLPPQDECTTRLKFSPVEEHFYRKQHETCVRCAQEVMDSLKHDLCKRNGLSGSRAVWDFFLSHVEASKILSPLLKLRQACCHPQVGSSGLRSLQQSPMTMDEILEVLISKARIEGEEALRRIVVALNGLAALSVMQNNNHQAVLLYKEALGVAEKNTEDFRLDPLLNLHIHHNLADLVQGMADRLRSSENFEQDPRKCLVTSNNCSRDHHQCNENFSENGTCGSLGHYTVPGLDSCFSGAGDHGSQCPGHNDGEPLKSFSHNFLKQTCENIKHQYLSIFVSKLSTTQQEFRNTHKQVSDLLHEIKTIHDHWWLQVLNLVEQNNDLSSGLMKKIEQALSVTVGGNGHIKAPRLRGVSGLKYTIQCGLEYLETARQKLLERLLEINQTMDDPREDEIKRVRSCPICVSGDGPLCTHCELDSLFQAYEARLFRIKKGDSMATSAEEAISLKKRNNDLNLFFRGGKFDGDTGSSEEKSQRSIRTNIEISRSPSNIEVILGTIKNYTKSLLKKEGSSSATRHLLLLETMRKEFIHARTLSLAQAQVLRAHDEIKMAQTRLRLREYEDEPTSIGVLSEEEIIPSSMQFTNDKFSSLSSLSRIKGQLRYLKGLVTSKKKQSVQIDTHPSNSMLNDLHTHLEEGEHQTQTVADDEPCPVCHEKLGDQKIMFQCGHITCCRCFLELTEQPTTRLGKPQQNWVMCPTCRQHTNYSDIAYVEEKEGDKHSLQNSDLFPGQTPSEISIDVQGSYGTKIEAITRRILWISSTDQEAKIIVFSSWNDVLDVLGHALNANNISYVRMKGGRNSQVALAKFKGYNINDPGENENLQQISSKPKFIQVLLLLIRHGANGLNILEAQHVILVEPLLNPGAEAQAINRVHRIGQEKKTFVHRFIVKNTVEESICKLNKNRTVSVVQSKSKYHDQPCLTLRDFDSLFHSNASFSNDVETDACGSLMHLPPSVAAGLAAEKRLTDA